MTAREWAHFACEECDHPVHAVGTDERVEACEKCIAAAIAAAVRKAYEDAARLVEGGQETYHEGGGATQRDLSPRRPGNLAGLAYAAAIRARGAK